MGQRLFSYDNYRAIIERLLRRGYEFIAFPSVEALLSEGRQFVLMRHDVDFSPQKALELAKIEAEYGITSTFFFLLRTEHYNIFSQRQSDIVQSILEHGHHLGLHFDCAAYPLRYGVDDFNRVCHREVQMLERWFGQKVGIVSYHRPSSLVLEGHEALSVPLPHTYMSLFAEDIRYYADSWGEWRFGEPTESETFIRGEPLHILCHPIWWGEETEDPYEVLRGFLRQNKVEIDASISVNCILYREHSEKKSDE